MHRNVHVPLTPRVLRPLAFLALAVALGTASAVRADGPPVTLNAGPFVSIWSPVTAAAGYGFAGWVERTDDSGEPSHSVLTVAAQFGAAADAGVHQLVFGAATEAWAMAGSLSMLTGLEASVINLEPGNEYRKIGLWSTFKNRPDSAYDTPPPAPANTDTQALRVESQPGTGFERGIVFAPHSLYPSARLPRPAVIDLSELSDEDVAAVDLIRIRANVALRYDPASGALYLHTD